jgi:very-short-patch-repair endonuclease
MVHRSTGLGRADTTRHRRIPVTTPARTLLDLGAVAPELVEPAMEDALFRGLVTLSSLRRALERVGVQGRDGTAVLRDLVDRRARGTAPTESPLEDALVALLRRHRLPEPVRQHPVDLGNGRTARVDLAYPAARLVIEADGRRWHSGRADFESDRERGNLLAARGWTVLRFGWDDVRRRGDQVVDAVQRVLEHRRAG